MNLFRAVVLVVAIAPVVVQAGKVRVEFEGELLRSPDTFTPPFHISGAYEIDTSYVAERLSDNIGNYQSTYLTDLEITDLYPTENLLLQGTAISLQPGNSSDPLSIPVSQVIAGTSWHTWNLRSSTSTNRTTYYVGNASSNQDDGTNDDIVAPILEDDLYQPPVEPFVEYDLDIDGIPEAYALSADIPLSAQNIDYPAIISPFFRLTALGNSVLGMQGAVELSEMPIAPRLEIRFSEYYIKSTNALSLSRKDYMVDYQITSLTIIPEPTSTSLLLFAVLYSSCRRGSIC